jgi:hypothetical protein
MSLKKIGMLSAMFGMITAMSSTSESRGEHEVNTPGNFKKCPKGAEEFHFNYKDGNGNIKTYSCYTRLKINAEKKFYKFLLNNLKEV